MKSFVACDGVETIRGLSFTTSENFSSNSFSQLEVEVMGNVDLGNLGDRMGSLQYHRPLVPFNDGKPTHAERQ